MLLIKTSSHIRNMRNVKSFRSCPTPTGVSMLHADKEIMSSETERMLQRNERRRWLIHQWKEHFPDTRNSSPQKPALMEMGGAKSAKVVFLRKYRNFKVAHEKTRNLSP